MRALIEGVEMPDRGKDDLSAEERLLLIEIGESGIVAFKPRQDEVITLLLDAGLIRAEWLDRDAVLLRLTS